MTGVVAQGGRRAIAVAQPAAGAEQQELIADCPFRIPAHPDVLGKPENRATRLLEQHLGGERQTFGRGVAGQAGLEDLRLRPYDLFKRRHQGALLDRGQGIPADLGKMARSVLVAFRTERHDLLSEKVLESGLDVRRHVDALLFEKMQHGG